MGVLVCELLLWIALILYYYIVGCPKKSQSPNFGMLPTPLVFIGWMSHQKKCQHYRPINDIERAILFGIFGHIWHIWVHIWARAIWSSGVSLKRSCKMQFRRVGPRSIGPSGQKLWPNQFFGRFLHCNYNVQLQSGGLCNWSIMLKVYVCHFLTKLHIWSTWKRGK